MPLAIDFIVLIELALFFVNHVPHTFLIGWDNVMPEFNVWINLSREFFGVWANYRGLGLLNGLSEIANLPHTFYIALLSIFLNVSDVRYISIISLHLAGGLGLFFLVKKLTGNIKASLISSLFYMFNLGVIQMFFAPLEVFAFHFAAIPIGALLVIRALEKSNLKNLFFLFLGSFLLSPQGFVPTLFIVYLILIGSILSANFIQERNYKKIVLIITFILAGNLFWLLPYSYGGLKEASTIANTRINEFASPEIYYRNQTYGDIKSVLTLKGFMLGSVEYNPTSGRNYSFMQSWQNLYNKPYYQLAFFALLATTFLGMITTIRKKKENFYPYLLVFAACFVFLANNTIPFAQVNNLLRSLLPVFGEIFRFPFTKFIILFTFSLSIFLGLGVTFLIEWLKRVKVFTFIVFLILLLLIAFPVFQGQFFSPNLKVKVPTYYAQLFDYLNRQPDTQRIAVLPMTTFWNWEYKNWGQFGSGFLWYGIKQPTLMRAFDPWSNNNEQFYNELSYAINSKNLSLFANTLKKYDIGYLLLDESSIDSATHKPIDYNSLKNFVDSSFLVKTVRAFGKLTLYEVKLGNSWVYSLNKNTPEVYPSFQNEDTDTISTNLQGNYVVSNTPDVIPLFPSLYTGKLQKDLEFTVSETKNTIEFTLNKSVSYPKGYLLKIPSLFDNNFLIPVTAKLINNQIYLTPAYPKIIIDNKNVAIEGQPIILAPKVVFDPTQIVFQDDKNQVVSINSTQESYLLANTLNTIQLKDGNQTEYINFDTTKTPVTTYLPLVGASIKSLQIIFPKINDALSAENLIQNKQYQIKDIKQFSYCCKVSKDVKMDGNGLTITTQDAQIDTSFSIPYLYHQASYIIFTKTNYKSGLPINFYIDNPFEQESVLETKLSTTDENSVIILPPTENYFQGYGLHLIVKSLGTETAQSTIKDVSLFPIPKSFLTGLALVNPAASLEGFEKKLLSFQKINDSLYTVGLNATQNSYLTLSQSFDSGWKAYAVDKLNLFSELFPFLFGAEIKEHVLVNNWENGWALNSDTKSSNIVIIYLPQYLEYLGFILLLIPFIAVIWRVLASKVAQKRPRRIDFGDNS